MKAGTRVHFGKKKKKRLGLGFKCPDEKSIVGFRAHCKQGLRRKRYDMLAASFYSMLWTLLCHRSEHRSHSTALSTTTLVISMNVGSMD